MNAKEVVAIVNEVNFEHGIYCDNCPLHGWEKCLGDLKGRNPEAGKDPENYTCEAPEWCPFKTHGAVQVTYVMG